MPLGVSSATWLALGAWVLVAMSCEPAAPTPPAPSTTASATPASSSASVIVMFDAARIDVEVTAPRPLRDVLPERGRDPSTWREIGARSVDGKRTLGVKQFAEKYPAHEVRLFVDEEGRPCVGVFRAIDAIDDDMPAHVRSRLAKPHLVLVDVATVTVRTTESRAPAEPIRTPLKVSVDGSDRELSAGELGSLPEAMPPGRREGGGPTEQKGWRLDAVIGLVTKLDSVAFVKVSSEDDSVMVKGEALAASDGLGLLRYNRRGEISFTLYDAAQDTPRRLKNVTKLIVASK